MISGLFSNLTDLQICIYKKIGSLGKAQRLDQVGECMSCILTDQCAEMRFTVMKHFRKRRQGNIPVVALNILKYQGKIRISPAAFKMYSDVVIPQEIRKKQGDP